MGNVSLLVNCFLRPGFLEAEGPGKVGVQGADCYAVVLADSIESYRTPTGG